MQLFKQPSINNNIDYLVELSKRGGWVESRPDRNSYIANVGHATMVSAEVNVLINRADAMLSSHDQESPHSSFDKGLLIKNIQCMKFAI